ncbi:hypothetical protein GVN24_34660 [Rhizobium sp. CRIBSB]|nr:hypothetical protein [Rhizobium sp. CRIBSB]
MNVYRYVIDHDMGFSPNPFHGVCTLANCKPVIRRVASVGDFVLGFGSAASSISGRLIYWMRVEEILTFDEYWIDPRFEKKKPVINGSLIKYFGDNIYHTGDDGGVLQEWSFHSLPNGDANLKNVTRDTGTTNKILVSNSFGYYGEQALTLPDEFAPVVPHGRGHRTVIQGCAVSEIVDWLLNHTELGFVGEPSGWRGL